MKLFETVRPDLLEDIYRVCKKHNLSLYDKIRKEENKVNLYSLLSEARFGLFFDKVCSGLKYNHKAFNNSKTTPDFLITIHEQDIVVDVCRLNPAKEDQDRQDAEDAAIEEFRKNNPGIPVMRNSHLITMKPEKLCGANGSIACKGEKYGPLVNEVNKPFLICLYFNFVSGHDALDLYHCLYGCSTKFIGDYNYKEYTIGAQFFDLSNALYYSNEQIKNNVSGVLLCTNSNQFIYYHNFSFHNRLNNDNVNWLSTFQYKEE